MEWVGRCRVGKVKTGENTYYPQIRLPKTLNELIGSEIGVWKVKTSAGEALLLTPGITDPDVQIHVQEKAKNVHSKHADVHYPEIEERISRLEKAVEQLTQMLSQRESSGGCSSGFDARSCAGVAEPGKGGGFRVHSRRGPWVQIPPPASIYS